MTRLPDYQIRISSRPAAGPAWPLAPSLHPRSDAPNARSYAVEWIGNRDDAAAMATKVSPLTYVRGDLPPILLIHGDSDKTVPPSHATRLHQALDKAGAPNQLLLLKGAEHGNLTPAQSHEGYEAVRAFLTKLGIIK